MGRMCGRFTQASPGEIIAELFALAEGPELAPRYNICPGQTVAAVRMGRDDRRELVPLQWGLIPSWAKEATIGARMINARAETVAEKPAFRSALRARRCLIVADGFFEWQKLHGRKQPHYIRLRGGGPFGFAGLWERWMPAGGAAPVESCTIVTTTPNELLAQIHDRMPVILHPDGHAVWLDPGLRDSERIIPLLRSYPAAEMEAFPVSTFVNSPGNDSRRCVAPLA